MAFLNRQKGTRQSFGHKVLAFVTSISMVLSMVVFPVPASADEGDSSAAASSDASSSLGAPTISKTISNWDKETGTGTLTLSVTGKSQASTKSTTANVIFIADVSGSMNEEWGSTSYEKSSDGAYGLVNGWYVPLYVKRTDSDWWGDEYDYYVSLVDYPDEEQSGDKLYYVSGSAGWSTNYSEYTGDRYAQGSSSSGTRIQAAKDSLNAAIKTVLAQNTTENPDAVQAKLITFSTDVITNTGWTTDTSSLTSQVNNMQPNGGTNWEAALQAAQRSVPNNGNTYVVFVSDGLPTFRNSGNGYNDYNRRYGKYGTGNSDPNNRNFNAANDVAQQMAKAGVTIYSINAFGEAKNMEALPGDYYEANDPKSLKDSLSKIIKQITNARSYKNVKITDNLSGDVVSGTADDGSIKGYTISVTDNNQHDVTDSESVPQPKISGQNITWDFGDMTLKDGYTYSVSFDVNLTDPAYEDAAKIMNGDLNNSKENNNIYKEGDAVKAFTNSKLGNQVDYTEFTTTDGKLDEGSEKTGHELFDRPTVDVPTSQLTVKKVWDGTGDKPASVTAKVQKDGASYKDDVTLSESNDWSSTVYVPANPNKEISYSVTEDTTSLNGWQLESYKWGDGQTNDEAATGTIKGEQSATATITNKLVRYGFRVLKTDDSSNPNPLSGATFTLTPKDGQATSVDTGDDGIASFPQLAPGTYTVEETKVPTGYQKLDGQHTLVISSDGTATWDGSAINTTGQDPKDGTKYFQVTVSNNTIKNLPSTGGFGVWPMLAGGVALVAAGIAFVIVRKREQ